VPAVLPSPPDGLSLTAILVMTGGATLLLFLADRLVGVAVRNQPDTERRDLGA
jgi:hypothetical protein